MKELWTKFFIFLFPPRLVNTFYIDNRKIHLIDMQDGNPPPWIDETLDRDIRIQHVERIIHAL